MLTGDLRSLMMKVQDQPGFLLSCIYGTTKAGWKHCFGSLLDSRADVSAEPAEICEGGCRFKSKHIGSSGQQTLREFESDMIKTADMGITSTRRDDVKVRSVSRLVSTNEISPIDGQDVLMRFFRRSWWPTGEPFILLEWLDLVPRIPRIRGTAMY